MIDSDALGPQAGAGEGERPEEGMLGTGRWITKVDSLLPKPASNRWNTEEVTNKKC